MTPLELRDELRDVRNSLDALIKEIRWVPGMHRTCFALIEAVERVKQARDLSHTEEPFMLAQTELRSL